MNLGGSGNLHDLIGSVTTRSLARDAMGLAGGADEIHPILQAQNPHHFVLEDSMEGNGTWDASPGATVYRRTWEVSQDEMVMASVLNESSQSPGGLNQAYGSPSHALNSSGFKGTDSAHEVATQLGAQSLDEENNYDGSPSFLPHSPGGTATGSAAEENQHLRDFNSVKGQPSASGRAAPRTRAAQSALRGVVGWAYSTVGGWAYSTASYLQGTVSGLASTAVTEAKLLPGTIAALPRAYLDTAASGHQADSLAGSIAGVGDHFASPFGGRTNIEPIYGHQDAFNNGYVVGQVEGFAMDAVMTASGVSGTIKGIGAIRTAGGLLQVGRLVTAEGISVSVVVVNGKAVVATAETLASLGLAASGMATAGANGDPFHQQAMMSAAEAGEGGAAPKAGLPATSEASVADKLERYLLNPDHAVGKPKAKWFQQALGFTRENAADLAKQIKFNEAAATVTAVTEHGTKFNQVITIIGANGKSIDVTFAWIKNNDEVVRLVTSIPTSR